MKIHEMTIQERINHAAWEVNHKIIEERWWVEEILERYFWDLEAKTRFKVHFNNALLVICQKIFKYCVQKHTNTFKIDELDDFIKLTKTDYGNLNTLCRFGLLFRKIEDWKKVKWWNYGVPLKRLYEFLSCKYSVARYYTRDPNTKTNIMSEDRIYANQVPKYPSIIDQETFLPLFVEYESLPNNYKE